MKKALIFLIAFALVFGSYGFANAAGDATFSFSPDTNSVATGESFNLDVLIAPNGEDLDTVRVVVSYPASMLEVTSYSLGSLFPSTSPGNSINNTTGTLSQGAFKTGGGVSSSGTVGTITFRALSAGTASVTFGSTSRAISAGDEKLSITGSGSASVTVTGDAVAGETEATLTTEQIAIGDFGSLTGYSPTSDLDWLAIDYMVNGYSGTRDLAQEQAALSTYVATFGATPSTSYEWNVVAAIAYSGAILEWDGAAEAAAEVAEEAEEEVVEEVTEEVVAELSDEESAIGTFGSVAGYLPSSDNDWSAVNAIVNGYTGERDLILETQGLDTFISVFGYVPSSTTDWNTVAAIAYFMGDTEEVAEEVVETEEEVVDEEAVEEVLVETEASLEEQALVYFGAFYARMPSSDDDWSALHCIAYGGCQGDPRDLDAEGAALVTFGAKYAKMPATDMEWNVISTLAYTDFLSEDAEEAVVEEEAVEEEVVEDEDVEEDVVVVELTPEELAIGMFGGLTGYLPSSDADWMAVDYMVNGYTPDERDLEAEATAVDAFVAAFGTTPVTDADWNVVAALAYSGAF